MKKNDTDRDRDRDMWQILYTDRDRDRDTRELDTRKIWILGVMWILHTKRHLSILFYTSSIITYHI